jgi:DNA-binding transcriptional LysR family regulator
MATLKQLSHALTLARYGNFHRAAEAEHLSQPALSRSIRSLENGLGAQLFDRQAAVVTPTLYGEALLQRAKAIFAETEEMEREILLLKGLDAGSFSVATGCFPAELSTSRALGELVKRHPNLRCHSIPANWRNIIELVLSRFIDLGIAEISTLKEIEDVQIDAIADYPVVLFCRRGHPLLGRKKLSKSDLDHYPLALPRVAPRVASIFPGKGRIDAKTGDLIPSIEVGNMAEARTIVLTSDAISATTLLQIEPWLRSGELDILRYRKPWMKLDYGFITLRRRMLSPATELYMQLVRAIEKEQAQRNRELMSQWLPESGR